MHRRRRVSSWWKFQIGDYQLNVDEDHERSRTPSQFVMHQNYNPESNQNDIILIRLADPILFSSHVRELVASCIMCACMSVVRHSFTDKTDMLADDG